MKYFHLLRGEMMKSIAELKRYSFNTFSGIITFYIIFLAMFFGIRNFAGPGFDVGSLDSLIAGYIMWMIALMGFQSVSYLIYEETQRGTLEQLYMCSLGIEWALVFRVLFDSLFNIAISIIILYITMLTTGRWLSVNFIQILAVLALTLPSLWGLGLVMGSLTMVFKRIQSFAQILTFGLIGVVAVNAYPLNAFTFLPFSAGATTLNALMTKEVSFPPSWYLTIFLISYTYFFAGIFVFKVIEKYARKKNLLSQY